MPGWFKNYSPQRFLISFALAAVVGLIASVASVGFVEGINCLTKQLLIASEAREGDGLAKRLPWFTVLAPVVGGIIVGGLLLLLRGNRRTG